MKKILSVALLFVASATFAQSHVFYKNKRGVYTEAQVDSMLSAQDQRLFEKGFGQFKSSKEVTGETRNGDTLFYSFKVKSVNVEHQKKQEEKRDSIVGKPLPDFTFSDINGGKISLSDFKGKPVVLNLWFTTCPPCIMEMPGLNKFKEENPELVYLAMTYEEKEKVTNFLAKTPFNFHHITNVKEYVDRLHSGFPTTLFIDKNGIVQEFLVGATLTGLDLPAFTKAVNKIK